MSGDPLKDFERLRARAVGGLHVVVDNDKPLALRPASLKPGGAVPPRQWLYGVQLVRRYVTALVAPGGVGKTAYATAVGVSVASGRALLGDHVHARCNVAFCNLEDPEDEFDRRLAACMDRHGVAAAELEGRVFTIDGRTRRLVLASLDADGFTVCYPDKEALVAHIRAARIGLVVVDPFVNSHELDENSNPHVNAAVRAWAEIAEITGCAVLLIHHTRKGATAGDMDSARGASALVGACRVGLTLTAMSEEEAEKCGVPGGLRRLHVRLDDAKANLAPPGEKARWFRLASMPLGNATEAYPAGDHVQAIEAWEPPSVWKQLSPADCNAALDAIAAGLPNGQHYTAKRTTKGPSDRWAGNVLVEMFDLSDDNAAKVINTWLRSGLILEVEKHDPVQRRTRAAVAVVDGKRP